MGVTANAHLTAGLSDAPFIKYPYDPPEWGLAQRDFMLAEPLGVSAGGWIELGTAPGLGYALDEAMLTRTRTA